MPSDYLLGPICSVPDNSCWKSGRLRMGSQTGSIFKKAMETSMPAGMESKRRSLLMACSGAPARASICASASWKPGPDRASSSWLHQSVLPAHEERHARQAAGDGRDRSGRPASRELGKHRRDVFRPHRYKPTDRGYPETPPAPA